MLNHVLNAGCPLLCQREGCQGWETKIFSLAFEIFVQLLR